MAIAVILDFKGGTLEQYDAVLAALGLEPNGPGEQGGLFHWVTETDDGIRVTDVWESQEVFQEFAETRMGPAAAEAGVTDPPEISFHAIHNYLTAP